MHYDKFREALKEAADSLTDAELLAAVREKKREVAILASLNDYVDGAVVPGDYDAMLDTYNYEDGVVQSGKKYAKELLDRIVQESQEMGLYEMDYSDIIGDDPDDMYNYSEPEFFDYLKVNMFGGKKHGKDNWLQPNGTKSSHKDMYASIFRHVAEAYSGKTADDESGLHPVLHAVSRLLMVYTRYKRGLVHDDDITLHLKYGIYK